VDRAGTGEITEPAVPPARDGGGGLGPDRCTGPDSRRDQTWPLNSAGSALSSLLIDADVYGGVVANVFGLLDDSPGLMAACRQAQSRRLDAVALSALCWQINPTLRVLTGIGRPDRWPELRPAAFEAVLEVARELVGFTVLDLGFSLETDEELSFDTVAPRRNGATLAALAAADLVLVVGSADPIGMQRLVRGLEELRSIGLQGPTWVLLKPGAGRGWSPARPGLS